MKKLLCLILALMLCVGAAAAEELLGAAEEAAVAESALAPEAEEAAPEEAAAPEFRTIPDALRFEQQCTRKKPREDTTLIHFYPKTSRPEVDEAIAEVMAGMDERVADHIPKGGKKAKVTRITTGPVIGRTGDKWMSFLTLCATSFGTEQVHVEFDARAYDMETGERLTLDDFFAEDSAAWALLEQEVRAQLTDYFLAETPDADALNALCAREAIRQAPFTFSSGTLMLHYRADALYPGHETLMHVKVLFPRLWDMMREEARAQTDNRGYRMAALTFDDGCAKVATLTVVDLLQQYGAGATFFVVGESMAGNHYVLSREHDACFSIGSHNYKHQYENLKHDKLLEWKAKYDEEMDSIIGIRPKYMRAPGGVDRPYILAGVGLPMIHWDLISGDSDGDADPNDVFRCVINNTKSGSIVLMHEPHKRSSEYVEWILIAMRKQDWLFVTVEELLALNNIDLEPGYIYYSAYKQPQTLE